MADDALSAAELETLLAGREPAAASSQNARRTILPDSSEPASPVPRHEELSPEAPGPDPALSQKLKRALAAISESCGGQFAGQLSALVGSSARVERVSISRITRRAFTARLSEPTCCNSLSAAPLAGDWILEISPLILSPAIDGMLGGACQPAAVQPRPLTDIELRLAARISDLFVSELRSAWRPFVELDLPVTSVSTSPPAGDAASARDEVIWICFEIELAGARGTLNLGIPARSLAEVADRLTAEPAATSPAARPVDATQKRAIIPSQS